MMRLATSLASLSLLACATEPTDPANGGGGKADDQCESAAYTTWLRDAYFPELATLGLPLTDAELTQALEVAETKPCTTGGDADYALWFAAFDARLAPLVKRFEHTPFRSVDDYAAFVTSATPSRDEQNTLTALIAVAPDTAGAAGYKVWLERYAGVLPSFYVGASAGTTTILEDNGVANSAETVVLAALEDARPDSIQEGAYATWFASYQTLRTLADEPADPFAARMLDQRPSANDDIDYLTFFVTWEAQEATAFQTAASSTEAALARLDALTAARPLGTFGGDRSYAPWFSALGKRLSATLGTDGVLTPAEAARLDRFVLGRPCSTTSLAADTASWEMLNARRTQLAVIATYLDAAKPVTCAAPTPEPEPEI
jgi:hypothetical protein